MIDKFEKNILLPGMLYAEYAKVDALNASLLKQMHRSPAHAKAWLDNRELDEETTEALEFGSAFHAALLEPQRFREFMVVRPKFDRRTKLGKQLDIEFEYSLPINAIVVKEKWLEQITGMLNSLLFHPLASQLLTEGVRETCLFWNDEKTQVPCKARFDFVSSGGIPIDIKTTIDAQHETASRHIFSEDRLYWLQAGHYAAGAKATKVCMSDSFIFIFIEKKPPYALSIKSFEGPDLEVAMIHRDRLVKKYKQAVETGIWDGYPVNPSLAVTSGDWFFKKYGGDE